MRNIPVFKFVTPYVRWWRAWRTLPVRPWVRAASEFRAGRFSDAVISYRTGLESHPDHPAQFSARLDLAFCLQKTRSYEEAILELQLVIKNSPFLIKEAYLRLAKLHLMLGHPFEAATTLRLLIKKGRIEAEAVSLFALAVIRNLGPSNLLSEAEDLLSEVPVGERDNLLYRSALARLRIVHKDEERGKADLQRVVDRVDAPFEALIEYASILFEENRIAISRQILKRALSIRPENPEVLTLLAKTYLTAGAFYNDTFAVQTAISACQSSGWKSAQDMHVLAEAYLHTGDKMSALLVASKAKEAGSRLLGSYRNVRMLDQMISDLSHGTQA